VSSGAEEFHEGWSDGTHIEHGRCDRHKNKVTYFGGWSCDVAGARRSIDYEPIERLFLGRLDRSGQARYIVELRDARQRCATFAPFGGARLRVEIKDAHLEAPHYSGTREP